MRRRVNISMIRLAIHFILVLSITLLTYYDYLPYQLAFLEIPLIIASALALVLLSGVRSIPLVIVLVLSTRLMVFILLYEINWQPFVVSFLPYLLEIILVSLLIPRSIKVFEVDRMVIWTFILALCVDTLVFFPIYAYDIMYFLVEIVPNRSIRYLTTALLVPPLAYVYFTVPRLLNLINNTKSNSINRRREPT